MLTPFFKPLLLVACCASIGLVAKPLDDRFGTTAEPRMAVADRDHDSELVFVSPHGKTYHQSNCGHLKPGAACMSRRDAKHKGLWACKDCRKDDRR